MLGVLGLGGIVVIVTFACLVYLISTLQNIQNSKLKKFIKILIIFYFLLSVILGIVRPIQCGGLLILSPCGPLFTIILNLIRFGAALIIIETIIVAITTGSKKTK